MAVPYSLRGNENHIKRHEKEHVKRWCQNVYVLRLSTDRIFPRGEGLSPLLVKIVSQLEKA
jgi:hypothetical protein